MGREDFDEERISELLEDLQNGEEAGTRRRAARKLGRTSGSRVVNSLIQALQNEKDERVRSKIVYALGRIGDECAVEPLIHVLKSDKESRPRIAVIDTLLDKFGEETAITPLMDILTNCEDLEVKKAAAQSLSWMESSLAKDAANVFKNEHFSFEELYEDTEGAEEKFSILTRNLSSEDEDIAMFCYDALTSIKLESTDLSEKSLSTLDHVMAEGLYNPKPLIRRWCCYFFGANGVKNKIEVLMQIAEDDSSLNVRYNAIGALGDLFAVEAIPLLIELLGHNDPFKHGRNVMFEKDVTLSEQAFKSLANIGFKEYLPQIVEYFEEADELTKIRIIPILVNYPSPQIKGLIRGELRSSNTARDGDHLFGYKSIIPVAIEALAKLNDAQSIPQIAELGLNHESYKVRKSALMSLVSCLEQGHRYPMDREGFPYSSVTKYPEAISSLLTYLQSREVQSSESTEMAMNLRLGAFPTQLRVAQFLEFVFHPDRHYGDDDEIQDIRNTVEAMRDYWITFCKDLGNEE